MQIVGRSAQNDDIVQPISAQNICFIHKGYSPFLEYAVANAVLSGHRVFVVSDAPWKGQDVTAFDLHDLMREADRFERVYDHIGVNNTQYELFCFQRWFIAKELIDRLGCDIWFCDHDILAYRGLGAIISNLDIKAPIGNKMFNSAWVSYISGTAAIGLVTSFFEEVYKTVDLRMSLATKYSVGGTPHLSDMHLLLEASRRAPAFFVDSASIGRSLGIDQNFGESEGFEVVDGYKKVTWENGAPYCKIIDGDVKRFYFLHLQGRSKYKMQQLFREAYPDSSYELPLLSTSGALRREVSATYDLDLVDADSLVSQRHNIRLSPWTLDPEQKSESSEKQIPRLDLEPSHQATPLIKTPADTSTEVELSPSSDAEKQPVFREHQLEYNMQNQSAFDGLLERAAMIPLDGRNHVIALINAYGFTGPAVEVGTFNGTFANEILEKTAVSKLSCVDPYATYGEFKDAINEMDIEAIFAQAQRFLSRFGARVAFVRDFSLKAAQSFADGSLDFVYVDGNHQSAYVAVDLTAWWAKVRSGGLIIGDDCVDMDDSARNAAGDITLVHRRKEDGTPDLYGDYGVFHALRNFAAERQVGYHLMGTQFAIPK